MNFGVIVHGGAWDIPDEAVASHLEGVESAIDASYEVLKSGNKAIDAVEIAIATMEDDPTFDAGKGSFVNQIAEVEMDAIIATDDYKIGSVAAIQNVPNPIKVARLVMEQTDHIMLVGKGANLFAQEKGLGTCNLEEITVLGEPIEKIQRKFHRSFISRLFSHLG